MIQKPRLKTQLVPFHLDTDFGSPAVKVDEEIGLPQSWETCPLLPIRGHVAILSAASLPSTLTRRVMAPIED